MQQDHPSGSAVRGFMTIGTLYSYLYCMLSSNVILSMPILGGAMYLAGRTAVLLGSFRKPIHEGAVTKAEKRAGTAGLILLLLLMLTLMAVYPISLSSADFWRLGGIVLCIVIRPSLTRYVLERALIARRKTMRILLHIFCVQLLFLPPLLLMLLLSPLDRGTVWALIGGYLLSGILESFPLDRLRDRMRPFTPEDREEIARLRTAHAYRIYQAVLLAITAALQITQVMAYTYIAVTADALILCMGIALLCTYAASALTDLAVRRAKEKKGNFLMMLGLVLWLYGIILFIRALDTPGMVEEYLSLALCTMGATVSVRVVVRMGGDMRRVAAFAIGHEPGAGVDLVQQLRVEFAALAGQLAALIGLTLICVFTATDFPDDWNEIFHSFSPLLTLPAVALVLAAIVFSILFPLTRQHMEKLRRYIRLQQEGRNNGALRDQLEAVVVQRSLKHYGIKLIFLILRPLYYHRIRGKENLQLDEDIPCVFVCNHGEIYGPVVATLYVPYSFRPWVAYEMTDKQAVIDHTMNGSFQGFTGWKRKALHFLMVHIGAPFLTWVMRSVDCIPVYHDNPRKLMQTFRETTAAMEAGDNILLFPENADTSADHRYVKEGVSEFFTGFAMIGQLYSHKTGKSPLFVPLYANKKERTVTFGVPTRYDPDIPPNEEKERLCRYLRGEMLRIAALKKSDE